MANDTPTAARKRIDLALQGGGSHGALTWGVLDRLLEDERLELDAISGTSAGAMNAVMLAGGLQRDGRDGARQALREFWHAVSRLSRFSPLRRTFWDRLVGNDSLDHSPGYLFMEGLTRLIDPARLNPLSINRCATWSRSRSTSNGSTPATGSRCSSTPPTCAPAGPRSSPSPTSRWIP